MRLFAVGVAESTTRLPTLKPSRRSFSAIRPAAAAPSANAVSLAISESQSWSGWRKLNPGPATFARRCANNNTKYICIHIYIYIHIYMYAPSANVASRAIWERWN